MHDGEVEVLLLKRRLAGFWNPLIPLLGLSSEHKTQELQNLLIQTFLSLSSQGLSSSFSYY